MMKEVERRRLIAEAELLDRNNRVAATAVLDTAAALKKAEYTYEAGKGGKIILMNYDLNEHLKACESLSKMFKVLYNYRILGVIGDLKSLCIMTAYMTNRIRLRLNEFPGAIVTPQDVERTLVIMLLDRTNNTDAISSIIRCTTLEIGLEYRILQRLSHHFNQDRSWCADFIRNRVRPSNKLTRSVITHFIEVMPNYRSVKVFVKSVATYKSMHTWLPSIIYAKALTSSEKNDVALDSLAAKSIMNELLLPLDPKPIHHRKYTIKKSYENKQVIAVSTIILENELENLCHKLLNLQISKDQVYESGQSLVAQLHESSMLCSARACRNAIKLSKTLDYALHNLELFINLGLIIDLPIAKALLEKCENLMDLTLLLRFISTAPRNNSDEKFILEQCLLSHELLFDSQVNLSEALGPHHLSDQVLTAVLAMCSSADFRSFCVDIILHYCLRHTARFRAILIASCGSFEEAYTYLTLPLIQDLYPKIDAIEEMIKHCKSYEHFKALKVLCQKLDYDTSVFPDLSV